jgi:AraC-like DNA-binding protein
MLVLELQVPPFPLLAAIGHTEWQPGMQHAQRCFDVFDLIICANGAIFMEEEGIRYEVAEGMMLVLEPGKEHRGYKPTEAKTEVYWIHFQLPSVQKLILKEKTTWEQPLLQQTDQDIEAPPGVIEIPKFSGVDLHTLEPIMKEMLELHRVLTRQRSFELHVLLGQFFLQLQKGMRQNSPQARSYLLSEKVAAYLGQRLEQPFDSGQMERDLLYHFDYLARCLKQYTGMSPLQYRHHLQMEKAKRLLAHSELPLKRIGELCGLQDNNYFTRLFKRQTSLTPGEYHRKHQLYFME